MQVFTKKFGCTELHSLVNGRLLLGTAAVGLALFAAAWDFLFPFPASRPVLIACVLLYPFSLILVKALFEIHHVSRTGSTMRIMGLMVCMDDGS